jgi:hypothetical protein
METLIDSVERGTRAIRPVDAGLALLARWLLPKAQAAACNGVYCGTRCMPSTPYERCSFGYPNDYGYCYCLDSWGCSSGCCDCFVIIGCC